MSRSLKDLRHSVGGAREKPTASKSHFDKATKINFQAIRDQTEGSGWSGARRTPSAAVRGSL